MIIAVLLGLITVLALNHYIKTLDKPALASIPHTEVVVAKTTIPQHTRIAAEMLGLQSLPNAAIHPEAIRDLSVVVGGISRTEIVNGEQVLSPRVATEDRRASLSYRVPEGMRAITIPVGAVSGVAGFISAGDRLDMLVTYSSEGEDNETDTETTTYTVFQDVLVLAAGGETHEKDSEEREVVDTVTLLVTPQQAEVVAWANLNGTFHLTLRSPLDEEKLELEDYGPANFETFRGRE
jgi:pilus assembly protein CpaB